MNRSRYYIKAMGVTCYDETGITFPDDLTIDLYKLVELAGGTDTRWDHQFGWPNQPKVLVFNIHIMDVERFNNILVPLGLIVVDAGWDDLSIRYDDE